MNSLLSLIVVICLFAVMAHLLVDLFFGRERERSVPATHRVVQGETLWAIASWYYPDHHTGQMVFEIKRCNNIEGGKIYPGQVLRLPRIN